ncbi:MAG: beta-propeller domain-containing protein, partial [Candidatus Micrarchaeota archaeon]
MRKGFVVPGFVPALLLVFLCLSIMGCVERGPPTLASPNPFSSVTPQPSGALVTESKNLKSFKSWKEIALFASASSSGYGGRYYGEAMPMMAPNAKALTTDASAGGSAADYSTTNVQVEGVDEADVVKNDGKYIYAVGATDYSYADCGPWAECVSTQSEKGKIVVMQAFPPSEAKIVSTIRVDGAVSEIFVYGDKLVAFGSRDSREFPLIDIPDFPVATAAPLEKIASDIGILPGRYPPYYYDRVAFVEVYDVSDKANPKKLKSFEVKGNYVQSRMIDGRVYGVFNENVYPDYPVPLYAVDGVAREIAPTEIKYFDWPSDYYNFQIFLGFDLNSLEKQESRKVIMAGYSQNIYASKNAFYLTNTRYDYYSPQWEAYRDVYWTMFPSDVKEKIAAVDAADFPAWAKERIKAGIASRTVYESINYSSDAQRDELAQRFYQKIEALSRSYALNAEKTVINKIALTSDGGFVFAASGEVPGHALNQFSMDESEGYFRIATTAGQLSRSGSTTSNNLYVLDSGLK